MMIISKIKITQICIKDILMTTVGSIDTNHILPVKTMKKLFVLFGFSTLLFQLLPIGTVSAQILSPVKQIALADNSAIDYYRSANSKLQTGDYQGAIADYTQAINIDPQFVNAYLYRAKAKIALGDKEGQLQDSKIAVYVNDHRITPGLSLGYSSIFLDQLKREVDEYKQAVDELNRSEQGSTNQCKKLKNIVDKGVGIVQLIETHINSLQPENMINIRGVEVKFIEMNAGNFYMISQCDR
jgi:tetratricopeptide (TPR) repeat protein